MTTTRLGLDGYGVRRTSGFAGKGAGAHPVGVLTQLALSGYGAGRYTSFADKASALGAHPVGVITQLALGGYGSQRYGDFSGKTIAEVIAEAVESGGRHLRLHRINDAYPLLPGVSCEAVATSVRVRVVQPPALPLWELMDPLQPVVSFLPQQRAVGYRVRITGVESQVEVGEIAARCGVAFTLPGAQIELIVAAPVARAGAGLLMDGVEMQTELGDFDDVYAQIDISDEDLLLAAVELVDSM